MTDRPMRHRSIARGRPDPLAGLAVFERGWLSSNNVLIHAGQGEAGAVLIDSGHLHHAEQTLALVQHALAGRPLALLANTHLHSDHCGGNAALQAAYGMPIALPPGQAAAVRDWDEDALSYRATGQCMARFGVQRLLEPGEPLVAAGRAWQVIAAPGHDPDAVMLFDAAAGLLLSGDALWANGFGVVFPEVSGEPGFDDVGEVLETIARLPVRLVIPGHGGPFDDVDEALARARSRLAAFKTDPARHARHAAKVLIKYHLMEQRSQDREALLAWAAATPLLHSAWERAAPGQPAPAWTAALIDELIGSGALSRQGERVFDA